MDAIILIAVFIITLALPFAFAGLWWWFWFWISLAALLGIFELAAYLKTKKTLSQLFWDWKDNHSVGKWWILAGLIGFWTYFLLHLYFKLGLLIATMLEVSTKNII
jgi:hypothetical protein